MKREARYKVADRAALRLGARACANCREKPAVGDYALCAWCTVLARRIGCQESYRLDGPMPPADGPMDYPGAEW